ncbi:O-antigen ligase family protein [Microbacterium sp. KUDC0406]|uniref:O-antigen ligase family protein n=1 Tax=Microbacterium sp. KUDC0406 TaxID=2909588 RepID=UPI001F46BB14|nr:O-antigen ligase family protein [Microbacterium sp. KUDC0406]UJP08880.1 O-antigen ligase family protein [Microbacterium sp. KUDC0406]
MLTVYVVLLFAVPSNLMISGLGALGRPSVLWGLVLLLWWVLGRLQARDEDLTRVSQPVRWALLTFVVVVLISYAMAVLRGQPEDQGTPALTSVIRVLAWTGVALVAMDGVRTQNDIGRLARGLAIGAGLVAALGFAQFFMGASLLEWMATIPGMTFDWGGIDFRGGYIRPAGTATHPLEFVATVLGCLPIAIAAGASGGFNAKPPRRLLWWTIVVLILGICLVSISRSAIIGVVVAGVLVAPFLPRAYRWGGVIVAFAGLGALIVLMPGVWQQTMGLFIGASDDPSALSRTGGLERLPEFVMASPILGVGLGTFFSRYYVFDNQWAALLVELGVAGTAVFAVMILTALVGVAQAAHRTVFAETKLLAGGVFAGTATVAVLFLFFDGLSFPAVSGLLFLLIGISAALRRIALSDEQLRFVQPIATV